MTIDARIEILDRIVQMKRGKPFEADKFVGLKRLAAFHLNDSIKDFNSRVDRHQHIGKGFIGLDAFRRLLNDPRFIGLPMCLETPKGPEMKEDIENLATLRSLFKN